MGRDASRSARLHVLLILRGDQLTHVSVHSSAAASEEAAVPTLSLNVAEGEPRVLVAARPVDGPHDSPVRSIPCEAPTASA